MRLTFHGRLRSPAVRTDADGSHPRCEFGLSALGIEAPADPDIGENPADILFGSEEARVEFERARAAQEQAGGTQGMPIGGYGPNPYLLHVLTRQMCDRDLVVTIEALPTPPAPGQGALPFGDGGPEVTIEVSPERLQEMSEAYTLDLVAEQATVKKLIDHEGKRYAIMATAQMADGRDAVEAHHLIAAGAFEGETYDERAALPDTGCLRGLLVKHRGKPWVFSGEQVAFVAEAEGAPAESA